MFDELERTDTRSRHYGESEFVYLNHSARPEAARVREALERMLAEYPEAGRAALRARLRSEADTHHNSAVFELAVHELLRCGGHTISALEPQAPHKRTRPDFLVTAPNGEEFYLEAVVDAGHSDEGAKAEIRLNELLRAIDQTECTTHWLEVHPRGRPKKTVARKLLKQKLDAWIKELPPNGTPTKPFRFEKHGLRIDIVATVRGKPGKPGDSPIGQMTSGFSPVTTAADIRSRLKKKAGKYGILDKPFVLAVNSLGVPCRERHALEAVFGDCEKELTLADGTKQVVWAPTTSDSFWGGNVAKHTRVSAVLSVDRLRAWELASRPARLIANPRAAHPLSSTLQLDRVDLRNGQLQRTGGKPLRELLGLAEGWP